MRGDSGVSLLGLYVCSAIAFVVLDLKLRVVDSWIPRQLSRHLTRHGRIPFSNG